MKKSLLSFSTILISTWVSAQSKPEPTVLRCQNPAFVNTQNVPTSSQTVLRLQNPEIIIGAPMTKETTSSPSITRSAERQKNPANDANKN